MRRALLLWVALQVACTSETDPATGGLSRPSGLVHVDREPGRSDVFIADTEAGGVRVLRLARGPDAEGTLTDRHELVRSTALFFPLAIPAGKAPTRVAMSADKRRLYVLSPLENVLHVLSAEATELGQSATEVSTFVPLYRVSLPEPVGSEDIPVDLAVLPPRNASERDLVIVAVDRVSQGDGLLSAVSVPATDLAELPGLSVGTATIAPGPRALSMRTVAPSGVWVSSAGSSTVSFVLLDAIAEGDVLGATLGLDAGGPTGEVIDAGESGAVGLRLDRPSVVVFDLEAGGLVRSTRRLRTPASLERELALPELAGVADLRPSTPVTGAHARLSTLPVLSFPDVNLIEPGDLTGDPAAADVVMIVHVDSTVSFMLGRPLRPAISKSSAVVRLEPVPGASGAAGVAECVIQEPTTCESRVEGASLVTPELPPDPQCSAEVVAIPNGPSRMLRAVFRGALVRELGGELQPLGTSTTSTNTVGFVLRRTISAFENRMIRPGDEVLLQAKVPVPCGGPLRDVVAVASVTATSADALRLDLAATSSLARACQDEVLPLVEHEIYPAGDEVVLTAVLGDVFDFGPYVGQVLARVGTSTLPDGSTGASIEGLANLTLDFDRPSCALLQDQGAACRTANDCPSAICVPSERSNCTGRCSVECAADDLRCLSPGAAVERRCTGIEIEIDSASLNTLGDDLVTVGGEDFVPAVPDDVVFSPMRQSWVISFPGARGLSEIQLSVSGISPGAPEGFFFVPIR